jgi:hypothetical protein
LASTSRTRRDLTIKPQGLLSGDNVILDLEATESNGANDNEAPATVAERARTFLSTADGLAPGHRVPVCTNPGFAETGCRCRDAGCGAENGSAVTAASGAPAYGSGHGARGGGGARCGGRPAGPEVRSGPK